MNMIYLAIKKDLVLLSLKSHKGHHIFDKYLVHITVPQQCYKMPKFLHSFKLVCLHKKIS